MITALLNGVQLPPLEWDFINRNVENAADVVTLDGSMYTDFVSTNLAEWSLQWDSLTEDQYESIRQIYNAQFVELEYPTLTVDHYGVTDIPVRMYINERDVWNHCGDVKGVQIRLRETVQLAGSS